MKIITFFKINKVEKSLARQEKLRKELNKIRTQRRDTVTDTTEIQRS